MFLENATQFFITFLLIFLPAFEGIFSDLGTMIPFAFVFPLAIVLTKKKIAKDNIFWLFLLFLAFCFISTFFSIGLSRSIKSLFLYFFYFVSFFIVKDIIQNKKSFIKILQIIILATSVSLSLFSFYYLIFHQTPPFGSMNLIYANFGHNHLVDYLIFSLPIAFCLFLSSKNRKGSFGWGILTLFFIVSFIFSFSRAGIAFAILALALSAILVKAKQKRFFLWTLFPILLAALFLFLIAFYLKSDYFSFAKNTVFFEKIVRPVTLPDRIGYWQQAIMAFFKSPVFGTGLDTFRFSSVKYQRNPERWSWFAHNHFLQMFTETGLFGGIAFLFLISIILYKSFRIVKKLNGPLFTGFFIGILVSSLHSLVDYDWQFVPIFLNFWVIAGFLLSLEEKKHFLKSRIFYIFLGIFSFIVFLFGLSMGISEVLFLRGLQVQERKGQEKAWKYFAMSLQVFPFHPQRLQGTAKYFYKLKNNLAALWSAQKSLDFEKANWEAYKTIGDINLSTGKRKEALDYYQKAINLSPLETADLYLQSAKIYKEIGDGEKEKEVLLIFFEKTKGVDNFEQTTDKAIEIFMQMITAKDSQLAFEVLERVENLNNDPVFNFFGWKNKLQILNILKDLPFDLIERLTDSQKAKYYFWMAALSSYSVDDKNLAQVEEWLQKARIYDSKNQQYKEFLEQTTLLRQGKDAFFKGQFSDVRIKLEKIKNNIEGKEAEGIAFYERTFYAIALDYLGKTYTREARETLEQVKQAWEKAIELNPWKKDYYLQLAQYYIDWQQNRDKARMTLGLCLEKADDPKECQKMLDGLK